MCMYSFSCTAAVSCFHLCFVLVYCQYFLLVSRYLIHFFFFFFQAEDGIRDLTVTGVQTCALPISLSSESRSVSCSSWWHRRLACRGRCRCSAGLCCSPAS